MGFFRKHWPQVLLLTGVSAAAFVLCARVAGAEARTRVAFAVTRTWYPLWPFRRGKELPLRLEPVIGPFVPVWWEVEPGMRMLLDPHDAVSRGILGSGAWEPASWAMVAEKLHPGDTFIDIGAHIGYYTLKAANVVGPNGRVIAIEPNPSTLEILRRNVMASGAGVVTVEPVACSDSETMLDFFAAARVNTGMSSLAKNNAVVAGPLSGSFQVRARPLDDIVRDLGLSRVDYIKIDVEGAELLVLKGARATLARFHPPMIVEVSDRQLKALGASEAELVEFLRSAGYTQNRRDHSNGEFLFHGPK